VIHVQSNDQIIDIFTKAIPKSSFENWGYTEVIIQELQADDRDDKSVRLEFKEGC
jgi:hypothetical protein